MLSEVQNQCTMGPLSSDRLSQYRFASDIIFIRIFSTKSQYRCRDGTKRTETRRDVMWCRICCVCVVSTHTHTHSKWYNMVLHDISTDTSLIHIDNLSIQLFKYQLASACIGQTQARQNDECKHVWYKWQAYKSPNYNEKENKGYKFTLILYYYLHSYLNKSKLQTVHIFEGSNETNFILKKQCRGQLRSLLAVTGKTGL